MIATDDLIRASGCACELRAQGLPMELLPVAVEDAERLSVALPGVQPELWYTVVKQLGGEIEICKTAKTFLATHDKYERKVARALHGVMLEMLDDVKRRMIDWQTYEPSRLLPYEKWWKRAQEATVDTLVEAAHEAGKETLRRYNRRVKRRPVRKDLVNESDLSWEADGTVLIDIPPTADVSMRAGALETMDKHYWKKWEGTTRAMVWGKIQSGLRNHLSLMEISDSMDDAWPFDFKRAMLVSRTETTMAMNAGHYVMGGQLIADPLSAVNGRQWLSILDVDTRATHTAANKQKIVKTPKGWHVIDAGKVIGSGALFILGGVHRARFPGDPNLPAKERVNCRCTLGELFNDKLPSDGDTPPTDPEQLPPTIDEPTEGDPLPDRPEAVPIFADGAEAEAWLEERYCKAASLSRLPVNEAQGVVEGVHAALDGTGVRMPMISYGVKEGEDAAARGGLGGISFYQGAHKAANSTTTKSPMPDALRENLLSEIATLERQLKAAKGKTQRKELARKLQERRDVWHEWNAPRIFTYELGATPKERMKLMAAHECGHVLDEMGFGLGIERTAAARAIIGDGEPWGLDVTTKVSAYAASHPGEEFAELHAMMVSGFADEVPETLQEYWHKAMGTKRAEVLRKGKSGRGYVDRFDVSDYTKLLVAATRGSNAALRAIGAKWKQSKTT